MYQDPDGTPEQSVALEEPFAAERLRKQYVIDGLNFARRYSVPQAGTSLTDHDDSSSVKYRQFL